ncbi:MAG: hypothetical protein ACREI2_10155 [Nitrospiraceae bacterium]
MSSFHLTVLGTLLLAGSAAFIAKAYLLPSFPNESAQTFYGSNPFQVRNNTVQRSETIAGILWLILGTIAVLLGIVTNGGPRYLFGKAWDILILLLVVCLAGLITLLVTRKVSRCLYLPNMIEMQKEGFEQALTCLSNEGRSSDEAAQGITLDAETKQLRLVHVSATLEQIGKLIDVPRRPNQDDSREVDRKVFRKEKAAILFMDTASKDDKSPKWFVTDAEAFGSLQFKEIAEQLTKARTSRR